MKKGLKIEKFWKNLKKLYQISSRLHNGKQGQKRLFEAKIRWDNLCLFFRYTEFDRK